MSETWPVDQIPTRSTLLGRLKNLEDNDSWKEFFQIYWRLIYEVALKAGCTESEAEEVVQETVISVSKKMPTFQYDPAQGSFKGWLLNLTRWRIIDQFRKRPLPGSESIHSSDATTKTSAMERVPDLGNSNFETLWNEEWRRNLLDLALERMKQKVKAKQYQIFDLYVLQKWSVTRVSKSLGVNVGQIYLTKHRLSKLLKAELQNLESSYN